MTPGVNTIRIAPNRAALVGDGIRRLKATEDTPPLDDKGAEALNALELASDAVQHTLEQRAGQVTTTTLDRLSDRLTSAFCDSAESALRLLTLEGVVALTEQERNRRDAFERALQALTPSGRSFLNLPYTEQYQEIRRFVGTARQHPVLLESPERAVALDRLELINQHLGALLGVAKAPATPLNLETRASANLLDVMGRFERAARTYTIRLLANYDDPDDPTHQLALTTLFEPLGAQYEAERAARTPAPTPTPPSPQPTDPPTPT